MKAPSYLGIAALAVLLASTLPLPGAVELPTATSSLFSASGNCVFCHDSWGGALVDKEGQSVSITEDWRGTMMAHAFKDPLWRAVMETEILENPKLKGFIQDKCQTCHAPMARSQHRRDAGTPFPYAKVRRSQLAADGVSCTLCHQIQPDNLGQPESFTGGYHIKDQRQIFGPYKDVFTMPMQHHVDYTPQFGAHTQDSGLCASCHTLYTPILNGAGQVTGSFPEQVPYLEWKASAFARTGQHCQDCHMPRLDEPIRISARPPWLDGREPFWRHQFVGGNAFMLRLMASHQQQVQPHAEPDHWAATLRKVQEQLQRSATLKVQGKRQPGSLTLEVEVSNLTGHKFPTGHPYRRAWLHVQIRDGNGKPIFESGRPGADGRLLRKGQEWMPHQENITRPDQVQVYESVLGNVKGRRTYGLLQAARYLKDNRIPPRGFDAVEAPSDIAVQGLARDDRDYQDNQQGRDRIVYEVVTSDRKGPYSATARLLYQAVPPEAVARLMKSPGPDARRFAGFYRAMNPAPEVVRTAEFQE